MLRYMRRWWRGFQRANPTVGVGLGVLSFNAPTGFGHEPQPVRRLVQARDDAPFYEMDRATLAAWYPGYERTVEAAQWVSYADTVHLRAPGAEGISRDAVPVDEMSVYLRATRYRLPPQLEARSGEIVSHFRDTRRLRELAPGRWENNRTARLAAFDRAAREVEIEEATYFDQVATNLTADTAIDGDWTVRRDFEPPVDGRLLPLSESHLANTLGVAGVLYAGGRPVVRLRRATLASIPVERLHCSVSGVLELPEEGIPRGRTYDWSLLDRGMHLEIDHELGLAPDEYRLFPVALTRELPRAGKPQLFYAIVTDLPPADLLCRLERAAEAHEYVIDPAAGLAQVTPDHATHSRFTYEGWAALWFAGRWREANPAVFGDGD